MEGAEGQKTWVEIDTNAIQNNVNIFRNVIGENTKLAYVVKSNAYGHDFDQFVNEVSKNRADFFCVDDIDEALRIRKFGRREPTLILGTTLESRLREAIDNDISITVSNFEKLEEVKNLQIKIHIKIDTGLGRQGFLENDLEKVISELKNFKGEIEGLYSHFATAKESNSEYSHKQVELFKKYADAFEKEGFNPIKHISSSAGVLLWPEYNFDMVRVGIGLYGLWPSIEIKEKLEDKVELKPALKWKCILPEIKKIPAGGGIGYGLTHKLTEDTLVGILPVGYWHGYPRNLSNIGQVVINDKIAKILGVVSMDMIMVNLNNVPDAKVGDAVELIGEQESAYDLAKKMDTSHYEIVTRINQDIIRTYK